MKGKRKEQFKKANMNPYSSFMIVERGSPLTLPEGVQDSFSKYDDAV
jgi:hypothetical protein